MSVNDKAEMSSTVAGGSAPAPRRKGSNQLDLLLLKAESYSKFILDNQQRTQAMQLSLYGTSTAAGQGTATATTPVATTKKANHGKSSSSKKRKSVGDDAPQSPELSLQYPATAVTNTTTPVKRGKETIAQPPNLVGGELMPHQLEGLQWLLSLWENGLNGILAGKVHFIHINAYIPLLMFQMMCLVVVTVD